MKIEEVRNSRLTQTRNYTIRPGPGSLKPLSMPISIDVIIAPKFCMVELSRPHQEDSVTMSAVNKIVITIPKKESVVFG